MNGQPVTQDLDSSDIKSASLVTFSPRFFTSSYSVLSSSCRTSRSRRTRSVPSLVTRLPAPFGPSLLTSFGPFGSGSAGNGMGGEEP